MIESIRHFENPEAFIAQILSESKAKEVKEFCSLALFYYKNAEELAKKNSKQDIKSLLQRNPKIKSVTLFRPYKGGDTKTSFLFELSRMPFEMLVRAFLFATEHGKTKEFFECAFCHGCIAKKMNRMSKWIKKNEIVGV